MVRILIGSQQIDCRYTNTRVLLKAGDESFSYSFKRVTAPGFTALYRGYEEEEEDEDSNNSSVALEFTKVHNLWSC